MENTKPVDVISERAKKIEAIAEDVIQILLKNELSYRDAMRVLKVAECGIEERKII